MGEADVIPMLILLHAVGLLLFAVLMGVLYGVLWVWIWIARRSEKHAPNKKS